MIDVKVPELAESIAEASLLEWQKRPGEAVTEGELLVSVETDKIVMEVFAPASGVLAEIIKKEGEEVAGEEVVARIDESAKSAPPQTDAPQQAAAPQQEVAPQQDAGSSAEKAAMPSARKLAAESGIALASIAGSGKGDSR